MADEMRMCGVVLAAGRSSRMGRDKALLTAPDESGRVLWERQRDVLRAAGCAEIYLSARPEQAWAKEAGARGGFAAVLHDALPDCGPLVGITAAFERAVAATHVAVIAIDLPRMTAEWFTALARECRPGVGAVGRSAGERSGGFEPLAAIYPRDAMWTAWEALARHEYSVRHYVDRLVNAGQLRAQEIPARNAAWFENWNEPVR